MANQPNTSILPDTNSKSQNKLAEPISKNCVSYRGFASIDQEMEREIALQWFQPGNKSNFFRGVLKNETV